MNYIITTNKHSFIDLGYTNFCELKDIKLPETIAIDTETTGLDPKVDQIFCVQIGTGENNYIIDLQHNIYSTGLITFKDLIPYIKGKTIVGHNISFDMKFFYMQGFFPESVRDTMLASMILHNGDRFIHSHSFGNVMERELGVSYDKSEQKNIHKLRLSTKRSIEYCFNDVDRLLELHTNLYNKLMYVGSNTTYINNCTYLKALSYMELCGLPLDEKSWLAKMAYDKKVMKSKAQIVIDYIYDNLPVFANRQLSLFPTDKSVTCSLTSNKQMVAVFKSLGINTVDDKGKESIEESVINKSDHPFVKLWLEYKGYQHRVTTFGQNILDKSINGRLYTVFRPIIDTNRMASRKNEINFLNFPADKETRICFAAKNGHKIVVCDFDNQEAVVLADKSKNPATLKIANEGADAHILLAKEVYTELRDLSDEEIKKNHKDKRQDGKIANFTFAYGGTGYTYAKNRNVPIEVGDRVFAAYRKINAKVFEWGTIELRKALSTGYIQSADGFRLKLPFYDEFKELEEKCKGIDWNSYKAGKALKDQEIISKEENIILMYYIARKGNVSRLMKLKSLYTRLCLNNPIQTTAAHQTKKAMIYVFDYIYKRGHLFKVKICNCVHDEIILEVPDNLVLEYTEVLGKLMRQAANEYLNSGLVKMKATAHYAENWYEAK